jgi:hypothetical protein
VDVKFTASYDRVIVCVCVCFTTIAKITQMLVKKIITQKWTIQLEVHCRQSLNLQKHLDKYGKYEFYSYKQTNHLKNPHERGQMDPTLSLCNTYYGTL